MIIHLYLAHLLFGFLYAVDGSKVILQRSHTAYNERVVATLEEVKVSFETVGKTRPAKSHFRGARLLFVPTLRDSPIVLNHAARVSKVISDKCLRHECGKEVFENGSDFYKQFFKSGPVRRASRLMPELAPAHGSYPSRFLRLLYATKNYRGALRQDNGHISESDITALIVKRVVDKDLGFFKFAKATVEELQDGRWRITTSITVPKSFAKWDPTVFYGQVLMVSRGIAGIYKLLGKSNVALRLPKVEHMYRLNFDNQLDKANFEVVDNGESVDFHFKFPDNFEFDGYHSISKSNLEDETMGLLLVGRVGQVSGPSIEVVIRYSFRKFQYTFIANALGRIGLGPGSQSNKVSIIVKAANGGPLLPQSVFSSGMAPSIRLNRDSKIVTITMADLTRN